LAKTTTGFLPSYFRDLPSIPGWFSPDAALMFMAYNQLVSRQRISGDVLEIGVYHGKSAIALASLRGKGKKLYAIDLFDAMQSYDDPDAALGMKASFLHHMQRFHPKLDFVNVIAKPSSNVRPAELGSAFSFCHIDGDHSQGQTYQDFQLCHAVLMPGGILAVDDFFNPLFPGVSEAAFKFSLDYPGELIPLAVGFNKALFQKRHDGKDLNAAFAETFPYLPRHVTHLWNQPVNIFLTGLAPFVDVSRSTPDAFVPQSELKIKANIEPQVPQVTTTLGHPVNLPVRVVNQSSIDFTWGISLSYHLRSATGEMIEWDNGRCIFEPALPPGEERLVHLGILSPGAAGQYRLELDLVWEGVCWFNEKGSATATVDLIVK
jgi:SAM-dependent methyltransferase